MRLLRAGGRDAFGADEPTIPMKTLVSLFLGLSACASTFATDYYVNSATGSPTNPGTQAAPFQNVDQVQQLTLQAGDHVYFARGGTYGGTSYPNYLDITASGTAAQPIVLTSYGSGDLPVFVNPGQYYTIGLKGNYVVLDGVKIQDTYESGTVILGDHDVIQNCEITNTGFGISIAGTNSRVTGNYIHHLKMIENSQNIPDNDRGAVAVNMIDGTNGADVGWNRISYCQAQSWDYGTDGGAFEFYGNVTGVQVHHNWCDHNNGVFEVGGSNTTVSHVTMYYNLFDSNSVVGSFSFAGTYASSILDFRFENNTVRDSKTTVSNGLFWFNGSGTANELSLKNNVFYYQGFNEFTNDATITHSYNLYYSPDGSPLGFTPGPTEIVADPQFVNLFTGDYHLQSSSPAVNAGTPLGYTYDREANPIVNTPDLGAFESTY
jgi:hypothetical protein